jgi:hypothetical protein
MNPINKLFTNLITKIRFNYKKPNQPWINPRFNQSGRQKSSYLHIGLYGLVFAGCFAAIPLYRLFC